MKTIVWLFTLIFGAAFADTAVARDPVNDFATCLTDSLNGKERKQLAQWVSFSMAAHPDIKPYSSATTEDIDKADEFVGKLVTRLLTVDCPEQFQVAQRADPLSIQKAFELVGQVAMQELMNHEDVMKALTQYTGYADLDKINRLISE